MVKATLEQRLHAIPQPHIRKIALRYLTTAATTLRPNTVDLRADSLITFAEHLAAHHPQVHNLTQLTREHIEGFLTYDHKRPWRGRVARDQPVSAAVSKRTIIDLRCLLDDLTLWGWSERPPHRLLFSSDIPRPDKPLPRALAPDIDRNLPAVINTSRQGRDRQPEAGQNQPSRLLTQDTGIAFRDRAHPVRKDLGKR